jgi:KDO2-lipid IV(A) lauroyltransferase
MPVELWHVKGGLKARVRAALPIPEGVERKARVAALTQSMADAFADAITAHPADWHMMQRLWLNDLSQRDAA